jgi:hypothetical protein
MHKSWMISHLDSNRQSFQYPPRECSVESHCSKKASRVPEILFQLFFTGVSIRNIRAEQSQSDRECEVGRNKLLG